VGTGEHVEVRYFPPVLWDAHDDGILIVLKHEYFSDVVVRPAVSPFCSVEYS
jgi:hypothetical protein